VVEAVAPRHERGVSPLYQIGFNHVPRTGTGDANGAVEDDLLLDLGRTDRPITRPAPVTSATRSARADIRPPSPASKPTRSCPANRSETAV
jgi:hypothetical protein